MQCMMKEICAQCLQLHIDPGDRQGDGGLLLLQPGPGARPRRLRLPAPAPAPEQRAGKGRRPLDRPRRCASSARANGLPVRRAAPDRQLPWPTSITILLHRESAARPSALVRAGARFQKTSTHHPDTRAPRAIVGLMSASGRVPRRPIASPCRSRSPSFRTPRRARVRAAVHSIMHADVADGDTPVPQLEPTAAASGRIPAIRRRCTASRRLELTVHHPEARPMSWLQGEAQHAPAECAAAIA